MDSINKTADYVLVATLFEEEELKISVAYKGEKKVENFYILNEIPYKEENLDKFKMLFNIFFSKNRPKEFIDFFVENDIIYSVFTYVQGDNIKKKYAKNFNTTSFDERCTLLESIFIYLDRVYSFPRSVLGCLTEPQNIKVDEENNIHFIYDLRNMDKYKNDVDSINFIFKNIADIILIFLEQEAKATFNKELHIVIDKCKRGVYVSIPQMVVELKRAERISKASSWLSYIKYQLSLRKEKIAKISKASTLALIVVGAVYLAYNEVNKGRAAGSSTIAVTIGGVNYNGNADDESDKTITTENVDNQTGETKSADIVLSPGLDIEYEDHIVQDGESIASICTSYYKDSKYITAVASFNGLDVNEKLTAGSILKLPNRTAIALYVSK